MRNALPWLAAALVIALDRVTKMIVVERLAVGSFTPVFPGFALTHVHNTGIAFSLFSDGSWLSRVLLHGVILTAVVLIAWMARRHGHHRLMAGAAFGLILGGALGNLIDRVLYGWVVDFVHVWAVIGGRRWSWPDFNVADAAITVGAIVLILNEFLSGRSDPEHAPDAH
jgi:signal peptidase II